MDLIIFLLLALIILFVFKDFVSFVYFLGIVEIFLRIVNFVANNIGINDFAYWMNSNFPNSIFNILDKYSDGLLFTILCWLLVICFGVLDFHLVKYFIKRR